MFNIGWFSYFREITFFDVACFFCLVVAIWWGRELYRDFSWGGAVVEFVFLVLMVIFGRLSILLHSLPNKPGKDGDSS